MPIQITCPSCSRQLRVPDDLVGKYVKCPSCDKTFTASAEAGGPTQEYAPEAPPPRRALNDEGHKQAEEPPPRPPRPRRDDDDDFDDDRPMRRSRRGYAPHRGTLILVLGVLSLIGGSIFTGIPAWIMGNNDMKEIRAGRMDPEGEANTNLGRILGMVGTLLHLIPLVLAGCFCCSMILAGAAGK